jgi:hypothetical protein
MTGSVKHPLLHHDTTALVSVDAARVLEAACGVAAAYDGAELGSTLGLSNHLIAVHRVHRLVSIAVEHNASQSLAWAARR